MDVKLEVPKEVEARARQLPACDFTEAVLWVMACDGPDSRAALLALTVLADKKVEEAAADQFFRRILLVNPTVGRLPFHRLYASRQVSQDLLKKHEHARRACVVDPGEWRNWAIRGRSFIAPRDYMRALLLNPGQMITAYGFMMWRLRGAEINDATLTLARKVVRWHRPLAGGPTQEVAFLHFLIGDLEATRREFQQLGSVPPHDSTFQQAYQSLAACLDRDPHAVGNWSARIPTEADLTNQQGLDNALLTSARYICRAMTAELGAPFSYHVRQIAAEATRVPGVVCEFGVAWGHSIRQLAALFPNRAVHGFDSFEGLPEQFAQVAAGDYSTQGRLPPAPKNVTFHKGWFEDTLPDFVAELEEPIAYLHIDCDLYSSTKTVFDYLGPHIVSGTVIVFDEYLAFEGWQDHEYKAFQEFIAESGHTYSYIGFSRKLATVAVVID